MTELKYLSLRERPELKNRAAERFSLWWGVSKAEYLKCMEDCLSGETNYNWYMCLDGESIVGGLGIIDNDFHDRKDLAPNICAVYTDEKYRRTGIAGRLLDRAVKEMKASGISPIYLVTDHSGFYERYGWEFLCMVNAEDGMSKMYIHR